MANLDIGGGQNQRCFIREGYTSPQVASKEVPNTISSTEHRPFNVRLYKNGTLGVYTPGVDEAIISYNFTTPKAVKYIGF